jgi:hypothetical protein
MSAVCDFDRPLKVADILAGLKTPWYIAGGWAIDLFLGRVTRPHEDIEIGILRKHQRTVQDYFRGWQLMKVVPGKARMIPWPAGEWLDLPVHEIHARRESGKLRHLEILLNEASEREWRFRRNLQIRIPLTKIGLSWENKIPFLAPEIVLLYKAKNPGQKDQADFDSVRELLNKKQRRWLMESIEKCHPEHPWIKHLS